MPEESPIDLDLHAAMIAHEVARLGSSELHIEHAKAHVAATRTYVEAVRRFLRASRTAVA